MTFKQYLNENLGILGIKELKDGLTLEKIASLGYHWIIEAGIKDAVLGVKGKKLIWYDGKWVFGTFYEDQAIWKKGDWRGGLDSRGNVHKVGDSPNKW